MLGELPVQAIGTMLRRPAQSALTMIGLTIGVAAFIAMVSFGEGARRAVIAQFEVLGANLLKVNPVNVQQAQGRPTKPLMPEDASAIRREATTVIHVVPVMRRGASVAYQGIQHWSTVFASLPRFAVLHDWHLQAGGMYDEDDAAQRSKVCVLGATPAHALFPDKDPLGATITVRGQLPCHVIGVLAPKGHSTSGEDLDDIVLLPLPTFEAYLGEKTGYSYLELEPVSPAVLDAAKAEVSEILKRSHGLGETDFRDYSVSSPLEVVRSVERTSRILTRLLQGIAAISLLVGGVGVMNIQLVSVAERTVEIGLRSAIGAAPRQILLQFLAEAAALSLGGAVLGIGLGLLVAAVVARWMEWPRIVSSTGVLTSALFGITVGVVFGYLPARRAARLDPVEALRHE